MTNTILQTVYLTASDDIVLVRKFPPGKGRDAPTFFGGLPRLPAELDWPYSSHLAKHISFLAQIDLATLPNIQWRSRLPASGTLFFFVNTDFERFDSEKDKWGQVLYTPKSCVGAVEHPAPPTLMPIYAESNSYHVKWLTHDDRDPPLAPILFPYWPVEPLVVRTFANEHPTAEHGDPARRQFQDLARAEQRRTLTEVFGYPEDGFPLKQYYANRDGTKSRLSELPPSDYPFKPMVLGDPWLPDDGWPYSWIFAQIFCAQLLKQIDRELHRPEPIEARAHEWRQQACAAGLFTPMPEASRSAFRAWVNSLPIGALGGAAKKGEYIPSFSQSNWVNESLVSGIEACLGYANDYTGLFPQRLLPLVKIRHSTFRGDEKSYRFIAHQILGAAMSIQNAVREYGSTHVLLAQFCYDEGASWFWGDVGVMQFWITMEDLKAYRFDRVIVTMEGG